MLESSGRRCRPRSRASRKVRQFPTQTARRSLSSLKDELEAARRQASMAAGQAKAEATKHAEELAKKLTTEQARVEKQQQAMKTELTQVGEAASTANTKIGQVRRRWAP